MSVYLRRIKDLVPPEEEGQRPACVDMRVRVSAPLRGSMLVR